MPKKRFSPEQIVTLLRQIEFETGQGKSAQIASWEAGNSEQSCATSRLMAKFSKVLGKGKSSSNSGAGTTTP